MIKRLVFFIALQLTNTLTLSGQTYGNEWINYDQKYYSFKISSTGIHRIDYNTLVTAGIPVSSISHQNLQLFGKEQELPVHVELGSDGIFGPGDYLLFYAEQNDGWLDSTLYADPSSQGNPKYSLYNDTINYFLSWNSSTSNFRYQIESDTDFSAYTPASQILFETSNFYSDAYNEGEKSSEASSSFYTPGEGWGMPMVNGAAGYTLTINALTPSVYTGVDASLCRLRSVSVSNSNAAFTGQGNHHLQFTVGSTNFVIVDTIFTGYKAIRMNKLFTPSTLTSGTTMLKWSIIGDQGALTDFQSLNYWSLTYPRLPDLGNLNKLNFRVINSSSQSKIRLDLNNVTNINPIVFVLGSTPRKVPIVNSGSSYQMLIPNDPLNNEQEVIYQEMSTLTTISTLNPVNGNGFFNDYSQYNVEEALLMVYHPYLQSASANYAAYRQSAEGGSHNVILAKINELCLQFGGGIDKHVNGIRRFAQYMYDRATIKPIGLFLMGKGIREANVSGLTSVGSGSRKNAANYAANLIPSFGQPSSDVFITSRLAGTSEWQPLIPTGRISAIDNQELEDYLNKVKLYEIEQQPDLVYSSESKDWQKQVIHFVGGGNQSQIISFGGYMNAMESVIEDQYFGGNVTKLAKTGSDPLSPIQLQTVMDRIEQGVSLVTYFGHASSTESGFEINIDDPQNWNNYGKYPIMLTNSCYNGNMFQSNRSKSEEFVNVPDYGAIAYIGNVNLGFANTLFNYSYELYRQFSLTNYGSTLGQQMKNTVGYIEGFGNNLLYESTASQMVLNGDPMIRLNWHERPEIELRAQAVNFSPENIDLSTDSIEMTIELKNLGRSILDTFSLEITRNFPDSDVDSVYQFYIPALHYTKTQSFRMPLQPNIGVGINSIQIKADLPTFIDEQYDEINNNQLTRTLFINVTGIEPVIPTDYAVVPIDSVTVKASTIDPIAPFNTYRFEIDTTDLFDSPYLRYAIVSGLGGVKEVHPSQWISAATNTSSPLICTDSTVYYWRVAVDVENPTWRERSFQYIQGKQGWGQDHFFQFENNTFSGIDYNRNERLRDFIPFSKEISCDVMYSTASPTIYENRWSIDNQMQEYGILNYIPKFHVAVIDKYTLEPWATRYVPTNENLSNNFGNSNDNQVRPWKFFTFYQNDANQLAAFQNMVENVIPDGYYILIYSPMTTLYDQLDLLAPSVYTTFQNLGSDSIVPGRPNLPFAFFCKKGDPTSVVELYAQYPGENVHLEATMNGIDFIGKESSSLIGPAAEWGSLYWKQDAYESPNADTTVLLIKGYSASGALIIEIDTTFTNNDSIVDLSSIFDAAEYPFISLSALYKDSVGFTPAQIDYWHVLYTPVPEAAIDGSNGYSWQPETDTLIEGENVSFAIDVKNIFTLPMDSLLISYWVTDQNQVIHPVAYPRQDSLLVGETFRDTITFSTTGLAGINSFWMEVNPYVNGSIWETDQPEQQHFNNLLQLPFYVNRDTENPILDVTFDGRHILNGDIVSPESEILITLKDENEFLILNSDADTSNFGIYITDPAGVQTRIPFLDGSGNPVMQWIPAAVAQNNKFKIIYPALFEKSGKYTLLVQGSDKSGNLSGDVEYRVNFEVVHESMITHLMNYPNPFSTSTRFVFTLTGSEVPDDLTIQIMNVSGRVVREITVDQMGPIHIGRNITEYAWDGKDEFGDPLANGVYLYRVKASINGEEIKHLESGADTHFRKGFGKMYLMR